MSIAPIPLRALRWACPKRTVGFSGGTAISLAGRAAGGLWVILVLLTAGAGNAWAQTVQFRWAQTLVANTSNNGLNTPEGVAVDAAGNVYIADTDNNQVLKETLSGGSYTQSTIASAANGGLNGPYAVAVDGSGNVYIADTYNHRVLKETLSGGSYTQSVVSSTLESPEGVAVDASGNVYIADSSAGEVLKETLSGGTYSASVVADTGIAPVGVAVDASGNVYLSDNSSNRVLKETYSSGSYSESTVADGSTNYGLTSPWGVAVDASGNVYVADSINDRIVEETPSSGSYTQSTVAKYGNNGLTQPEGVALNGNGAIYIADTGNSRVLEENPNGANLGSVSVGSTSQTGTLFFTFTSAGSLNTTTPYQVMTSGATGLDFADAGGTGECSGGVSYNIGDTCFININLTPLRSGPRYGAVSLYGTSGSLIATVYLQGVGLAPQAGFAPGSTTPENYQVVGGLDNYYSLVGPDSLAIDSNGDLYVGGIPGTYNSGALIEETPGVGGAYSPSVVESGLLPTAIAVDGAGNIFFTTQDTLYEESPTLSGYAQSTLASGLDMAEGLAVDGIGNVYVAEKGNGLVLKEAPSPSGYIQSSVGTRTAMNYIQSAGGLAVDGNGTLYIGASIYGTIGGASGIAIVVEMPSGGGYVESAFDVGNFPISLTVDENGNLWVGSYSDGTSTLPTLMEEAPSPDGYVETVLSVNSAWFFQGLAVDNRGGVYFVGDYFDSVRKFDYSAAPALTFASTTAGTTSSAQSVTFQNIGNATLTAISPGLSVSADYTQVAGSGTPLDCTASFSLAPLGECNLSIEFAPVLNSSGTVSGSLTLTDNSMYASPSATQTISLTGTATIGMQAQLAFTAPPPGSLKADSSPGMATVSVEDEYGNVVTGSSATVTLTVTGPDSYSQVYMATASSGVASFGSLPALTAVGSYTYTATDTTDGLTQAVADETVSPDLYTAPSGNVGSTGTVQTATLVLNADATLNATLLTAIQVVTQGVTGKDFAYATGGTCTAGTAYSQGQSCTVNYTFTPKAPGVRMGAILLYNNAATPAPVATVYLSGTGTGPAAALTPGMLSAVAGNGTPGYSGDTGLATSAELDFPTGVAVDAAGNMFIADFSNNVIREVSAATGDITTVAGNETPGYEGDNGLATSAELYYPASVTVDGAGNLFIADSYNNVIREVAAGTGVITTVAGNGTPGYMGDNGQASSAELSGPQGVAVDSAGDLYIVDTFNNVIREVTAGTGVITTVAGNGTYGYSGDTGAATSAELEYPEGMALDGAGNLYIADSNNNVIREVSAGVITTIAGNGTGGYGGDNGLATSARLNYPAGVAVDAAGNVYIADTFNSLIREVSASTGIIGTVAGTLTTPASGTSIPATSAQLSMPQGVGLDGAANIYIADGSNRILQVAVDASSLSFETALVNMTSGDSPQTVTVSNDGNYALTIDVPPSGNNANITGAAFTLASGVTPDCPLIASGTSAGSLAAGAYCVLPVSFTPQVEGANTGTLTLEDNTLNVDGTMQSVSLSGTGGDVTVGTTPAGLSFTVDGTPYSTTQVFDWTPGQQHTLTTSVQTSSDGGTEYTPTGWSDGTSTATDMITVTSGTTSYTANYSISYLLSAEPDDAAYGTVSPTPSNYYAAGSMVTLTATPSGGVFSDWTGSSDIASPTSASTTITMNSPEYVTANFVPYVSGASGAVNFGSEAINSTSTAQSVSVNIQPGATVGSIAVFTTGYQNFDFASVSGGSCTATTYSTSATCTVDVTFTPAAAGLRQGAVVFFSGASNTGTVLGNVPIYGTGSGPEIAYSPAPLVAISDSRVRSPLGVATDVAGDVFIANGGSGPGDDNGSLVEVTGGGTKSLLGTGWSDPTGVAVDGAGDLLVADYSGAGLVELPAGGGAQFTVPYNGYPYGVAFDASDNIYIADELRGQVVEIAAGTGAQTQIGSGWSAPTGVAVDSAGNVYVADPGAGTVSEVAGGTGTPTPIGTGWVEPGGIAVDGVGNVYVADLVVGVVELAAGTFAPTTLIGGDGTPLVPDAVAVDGGGDVYTADFLRGSEHILVRSDTSTLSFPTATLVDTTDTTDGTLTAEIENIGNMPLTLTALSYPTDFPIAAGDVHACTSSTVVPAASECDLPVTFAPLNPGYLSESVTLTDDALNITGSQQSVGVNGTASPFVAIAKQFGAASITAGGTTSLTITLSNASSVTQSGIAFSDTFPTGMTVANPSGLVSTCTGTASATAGGTTLSLSGASLNASASCTVAVNITSLTPGLVTNTTGAVSSTPGGAGLTASAIITVDQITPVVTLNAIPALLNNGTSTTLTAVFTTLSGAPAPTQPMNFYAGATLLGTGTLSISSSTTYTATLSTASLPSGTQSITATYPGDSSYLTASSAGQPVFVIANNLWIGDGNSTTAAFSATGAPYLTTPESQGGTGVAIDSSGDVWSLNAGSNSVAEFSNTGTVSSTGYTGGGLNSPTSLAIDGNGNVWIANSNGSISEFNSSGTAVSPPTGYTGGAGGNLSTPSSIAVDISGNLWIANSGSNTVTQVLGVAAPTVPLATGVANNSTATKP